MPPSKRRKVSPAPGQPPKDGELVEVDTFAESWSQYFLEDGTILRLRPVLTEVVLLDDERDESGNPIYVLKATLITSVIPSERLRRG